MNYTISEFATKAGISTQEVYKQISNSNSSISKYIVKQDNNVFINELALICFNEQTNDNERVEINNNAPARPARLDTSMQSIQTDYIEFLKSQIAELKADKIQAEEIFNTIIRDKDDIIKNQAKQIESLMQQLSSLNIQMAEIANKALVTTSQQQYLAVADKQEQTIVEEPKKGFLKKLFR